MRRFFFFLSKVSVSLILISLLFKFIDFRNLIRLILQARLVYLVLAFTLFLFVYVLALVRWRMLLETVELKIPFKRTCSAYFLSLFVNLFFPSTIGGDLARSVDLAIHTKRKEDVAATVFLDRLSGYFGLIIICTISLLLGYRFIRLASIYLCIGIIFVLFLLIVLILFNRAIFERINSFFKRESKICRLLKEIHFKIYTFRKKPKIVIYNLVLSVFIQLFGPIICYILAIAFGKNLSLIYFLVIIPVVGTIAMLPISIGGLGVRDLSMVYFFSQIDISLKDTVFAISLLSFFFVVLTGLFGGIFHVFTFHPRRLQYHEKGTSTLF